MLSTMTTPPRPASDRDAFLRAWAWTASAMAGAIVVVGLAALPSRDWHDDLTNLQWLLVMMVAVQVPVAAAVGALVLWWRLRHARLPYAGKTALLSGPTGWVLGLLTLGVATFLSPPLVRWLVVGAYEGSRARVVGARLVIALGAIILGVVLVLGSTDDPRFGGHVHGTLLVWAAAMLAVAIPVGLVLGPRAPLLALAVTLAGAVTLVPLAHNASVDALPSADRLARDVTGVPLPHGTSRDQRVRTTEHDPMPGGRPAYVVIVAADARLEGDLEPFAHPTADYVAAPATDRGREVAREWAEAFRASSWEAHEGPGIPWGGTMADLAQRQGSVMLARGSRVDVLVIPAGDGAVVVARTNPSP
jgi:hypothetical protein